MRKKAKTKVNSLYQKTLDSFPSVAQNNYSKLTDVRKRIILNEIDTSFKDNELVIKVGFSLYPTRESFSKLKFELFVNSSMLKKNLISIPQSPLATNDFELSPIILDMKGLDPGLYSIRANLNELLTFGKSTFSTKESVVKYSPIIKEKTYIRIPIVKRFEGQALEVLTEADKGIYKDFEQTIKKERVSKQDEW